MRIYLHPFESEGIPVDASISPDEAEEWVNQLRSAIRKVREGQGDQLLLLGEPARMTLTVMERASFGEDAGDSMNEDERNPLRSLERFRAATRAFAPHVFAFFVILFLLELAIRFLP